MKKIISKTLLLSLISSSALFAEIKLGENSGVTMNGSMEANLFSKTNNLSSGGKAGLTSNMEINTIINFDGLHDTSIGNIIWRVAQKVGTDARFDSWGLREAWGGLEGKAGTIKIGNQFSNMYLIMDGPAGAKGMGNLFADFGAHEVQYTRALSYYTPKFANFQLLFQYDFGGFGQSTFCANQGSDAGQDCTDETAPAQYNSSGAFEGVLNYTSDSLVINLGTYAAKNNGTLDMVADVFNGDLPHEQAAFVGYLTNSANIYMAHIGYNIGGFDITLAYKHNILDGELYSGYKTDGSLSNDHALARLGYTFDKNKISLGYQILSDSKDNSGVIYSSIQSVNLQYDRSVSENANAFVQLRHQMYGSNGETLSVDGMLNDPSVDKRNVSRILVGLWVGF